MLRSFRAFLFRGNVVELAVAVAIGTAFTTLIGVFGTSFIKPLVGLLGGGGVAGGTFTIRGQTFDWGAFANAIIFFVITAAAIYFVVVMPMEQVKNRLTKRDGVEPAPKPTDVELLTEIRDLLRQQAGR
ncbi:MAG TPA: large conductance mechanosensitive channel protein MscL [Mycobacteriales bacterium]|nr:large conductance mechanosensitive channel protein MscL [Mycobacteriales bacterium]